MKRKRRGEGGTDFGSLDIFIDVLMNTVGVLMVTVIFLSVRIGQALLTIPRTPAEPTPEKLPYYFELRGTSAIDFNDTRSQVNERLTRLNNQLATCSLSESEDCQPVLQEYRSFEEETDAYQVSVRWEDRQVLYRPKPTELESCLEGLDNSVAECLASVPPEESFPESSPGFTQQLDQLDPDRYYIAFIVRPTGFETYRQARSLAEDKGFQVAWEPYQARQPIAYAAAGEGSPLRIQ